SAAGTLASENMHLTVDQPPTISLTTSSITIAAGTLSTNLFAIVGDVDTSPASLVLSATSSNPGLVPTNVFFGGSGASRTFTIGAPGAAIGTSIVTIKVADLQGGFASANLSVTVTAP